MLWSDWHRRILLTNHGERTNTFLRGLNWMLLVAVVGRVTTGLATLLAARVIGPAHYGEASLALAATLWIQLPLFAGLPIALLHYTPQASDEDKRRWLTAGIVLLAFLGSATLTVGWIGRNFWSGLFAVSERIWSWGLLWCAGFFFFTVAATALTARERFRARAVLDLLFALLFPATIFIAWRLRHLDAWFYILALTLGYAASAVLGFRQAFRGLTWEWPGAPFLRRLGSYGLIASLGGVAGALLNTPARLIAHQILGVEGVGILAAYQAGSIQMASFFLAPVIQVFFPIASRTPDKSMLLRKLTRLMLALAIPLATAFFCLLAVYMLVLGKRYPFNAFTAGSFAVAAVASTYNGLLAWYLAAAGRRGLLASGLVGLAAGGIHVLLCRWWIPRWQLPGAAWAMGVSACIGIAAYYLPVVRRSALPRDTAR